MQFSSIVSISALLAATLAAPAPVPAVKSMMAEATQWTIESFTRTCNEDDSSCDISFGVNTNTEGEEVAQCAYSVTGSPASRAPYNSVACGDFTIGSSWSNQFGDDQAFSTLSVVRDGLIIFPAYTDAQLVNGQTVSPDQSYTPQALP